MKKYILLIILLIIQNNISYAQKLISGKVIDEYGNALPGVTVTQKGTNNGTITDINGEFRIEVTLNKTTLIFSFIGMNVQEIQADNQTSVNVVMDIGETIDFIDIPKLEFPPPKPSSRYIFNKELFMNCDILEDVNQIISNALIANGYSEKSYFSVPNGFAVVTRIEKINEDGTSMEPPERWSISANSFKFTISNYLKALFLGNKGYYRVIVFIITDKSFSTTKKVVTREEAFAWLQVGSLTLPDLIGEKKFTKKYKVISLVYEFTKKESTDPILSDPSVLTGQIHLNKSNILPWLQSNH